VDKFTEEHKKTLEKYSSLIHLTLNDIGLESLENFPKLNEAQIVSNNLNKIFLIFFICIYID